MSVNVTHHATPIAAAMDMYAIAMRHAYSTADVKVHINMYAHAKMLQKHAHVNLLKPADVSHIISVRAIMPCTDVFVTMLQT